MHKGTIVAFRGIQMSGLGWLVIAEKLKVNGKEVDIEVEVPCDNAATVRALESAFGNVIGEGHGVNPNGGHVGKEVFYSTDYMGVLDGFSPVEDAPTEVVWKYENQR